MAYLDDLSDNQLDALEMVLGELKTGKGSTTSIRDIVDDAPGLSTGTTLYRYYKTSSFKGNTTPGDGYRFEEKNYLVLSTKKLPSKSGSIVLEFKMPKGTKAVPLGDDAYLLDRGTVYYIADNDASWVATIKESAMVASAAHTVFSSSVRPAPRAPMMFFNGGPVPERCDECGMSPIQEFYNRCHSGQNGKFCGGRGQQGGRGRGGGAQGGPQGGQRPQGSGRPGGGGRPAQRAPLTSVQKAEKRAQTYRNILGAVTATIGVVAVVASAINAFGNINQAAGARRQVGREDILKNERRRKEASRMHKDDQAVFNFLNDTKVSRQDKFTPNIDNPRGKPDRSAPFPGRGVQGNPEGTQNVDS